MKQNTLLLFATAFALAACVAEPAPENPSEPKVEFIPGPTSFSVYAEGEPVPVPKAVIGQNGNNKPQTFWEDGDAISVYSSKDTDLSAAAGHKFVTHLSANATSATFELADENPLPAGNYLATYPYRSAARGVNFSVDPYRVAAVDVPNSQTLVAGSFDRKANPAVAYMASDGTSMPFKNAAALLKFRVSEPNIVVGRIEVDPADIISGRFRADVNTATYEPVLTTYVNQNYYNYIDFKIDGTTALATGTDYYVAVRPTTLTSDLKIYLNGNLVKTINASQLPSIARNGIYNLGTLTTPSQPTEKKLVFDFTVTPKDGWPRTSTEAAGRTNAAGGCPCVYPLYGTNYTFVLADCTGASGSKVYWSNTVTYGHRIVFENAERYLGVPAINGYKLVHITAVSAQLNDASSSTSPKVAVVTQVVANKANQTYVTGGELQTWAPGNNHESYEYSLSGTEDNTMYYLFAKIKGGIASLTLTYVPI